MLAGALVALSAAIILALGAIHLVYTFWGPKLIPRDPALEISMRATAPVISCGFRRIRPGIPSEGGHRFRLKPAGDSDDPGHLGGGALVSACSSGQAAGWASRL